MAKKIIGRAEELRQLATIKNSGEAELLAVYGRRRVGKTHLIREYFKEDIIFECSGLINQNKSKQIENFTETLRFYFKSPVPFEQPKSWLRAFRMLINLIDSNQAKGRKVIFLDEFPWFETARSEFLSAFDHFWNSWASRQDWLVVVICGSAASWMVKNILKNKGGLHNRITQRMRLLPFTLGETKAFLEDRKIQVTPYQIIQLYMVTGGIPHYLKGMLPSDSATTYIDRLCFSKDGLLRDEFSNLYPALFSNSERHLQVIRVLAEKPTGCTRTEILNAAKLKSGGGFSQIMEELTESGFVLGYYPFGKNTNNLIFKLSDEYSLFYLKFIEKSKATGSGTWLKKSKSPSWNAWSGLAFESICLKHIPQIKEALRIGGVYSEQTIWRQHPTKTKEGAQIDLVIDRDDDCINLVEIKFSKNSFTIDAVYAERLRRKKTIFAKATKTKKALLTTLLTASGVEKNGYYREVVQSEIVVGMLFG